MIGIIPVGLISHADYDKIGATKILPPHPATKVKVLKTDREDKTALAYIERIMDQPSPDEAELDLWALLVENYEGKYFPIAKPDPVEAIRFRSNRRHLHEITAIPKGVEPAHRR